MSEETNQGIDLGVNSPEIMSRMAAFVDKDEQAAPEQEQGQPEAPAQEAAEAPTDQATDEPTPEDIQDEVQEAQSQGEVYEIVVDGKTHRVESREEAIKYMQQGFDYTQKTQALAEKARNADVILQRLQAVEQVMPLVQQDLGVVKSLEAQLQRYSNVDWVRLASEDPLEYPKHRAQYDQLVQAYQGAVQSYNHKSSVVQQERQQIHAQRLASEAQELLKRIPDWADQAKYEAGTKEVRAYLIKQGADPQEVDGLSSAIAVDIARKAMLYDRLKSLKAEKSKQLRTVPPVPKPGATSTPGAEKAQKAQELHKKVGTRESAVGALLARMGG